MGVAILTGVWCHKKCLLGFTWLIKSRLTSFGVTGSCCYDCNHHRNQKQNWTDIQKSVSYISPGKTKVQWRIQDFPEEGAPTPRGAPTYDFVNFRRKLHENEEILAARGGASPAPPPPLDPPLVKPKRIPLSNPVHPDNLFSARLTTSNPSYIRLFWIYP